MTRRSSSEPLDKADLEPLCSLPEAGTNAAGRMGADLARKSPGTELVAASERLRLHNFKSVGLQIHEDCLGDMRALFRRNPLIVQMRAPIAFRVFDKSRVNGIRDPVFRLC